MHTHNEYRVSFPEHSGQGVYVAHPPSAEVEYG